MLSATDKITVNDDWRDGMDKYIGAGSVSEGGCMY